MDLNQANWPQVEWGDVFHLALPIGLAVMIFVILFGIIADLLLSRDDDDPRIDF